MEHCYRCKEAAPYGVTMDGMLFCDDMCYHDWVSYKKYIDIMSVFTSDEMLKTKLPKGHMFKNIGKHNRSPKWVIVPLTGSFANIRGL